MDDMCHKVIHHDHMECVPGNVLFNEAAVCLKRYGEAPASGTQAQRHIIQCLAFSIPEESSPLLYMES